MCTYENADNLWISYKGGATFIRVCPKCGRFVKAYKSIKINGLDELMDAPNATCGKCGRVKMLFQGFPL